MTQSHAAAAKTISPSNHQRGWRERREAQPGSWEKQTRAGQDSMAGSHLPATYARRSPTSRGERPWRLPPCRRPEGGKRRCAARRHRSIRLRRCPCSILHGHCSMRRRRRAPPGGTPPMLARPVHGCRLPSPCGLARREPSPHEIHLHPIRLADVPGRVTARRRRPGRCSMTLTVSLDSGNLGGRRSMR